MKGIVIKPTPCCGSTSDLGKIYEFNGEPEVRSVWVAACVSCGHRSYDRKNYYQTNSFVSGYVYPKVIQKNRVRFFNDDLELEDTTEEEVTKEIENASV